MYGPTRNLLVSSVGSSRRGAGGLLRGNLKREHSAGGPSIALLCGWRAHFSSFSPVSPPLPPAFEDNPMMGLTDHFNRSQGPLKKQKKALRQYPIAASWSFRKEAVRHLLLHDDRAAEGRALSQLSFRRAMRGLCGFSKFALVYEDDFVKAICRPLREQQIEHTEHQLRAFFRLLTRGGEREALDLLELAAALAQVCPGTMEDFIAGVLEVYEGSPSGHIFFPRVVLLLATLLRLALQPSVVRELADNGLKLQKVGAMAYTAAQDCFALSALTPLVFQKQQLRFVSPTAPADSPYCDVPQRLLHGNRREQTPTQEGGSATAGGGIKRPSRSQSTPESKAAQIKDAPPTAASPKPASSSSSSSASSYFRTPLHRGGSGSGGTASFHSHSVSVSSSDKDASWISDVIGGGGKGQTRETVPSYRMGRSQNEWPLSFSRPCSTNLTKTGPSSSISRSSRTFLSSSHPLHSPPPISGPSSSSFSLRKDFHNPVRLLVPDLNDLTALNIFERARFPGIPGRSTRALRPKSVHETLEENDLPEEDFRSSEDSSLSPSLPLPSNHSIDPDTPPAFRSFDMHFGSLTETSWTSADDTAVIGSKLGSVHAEQRYMNLKEELEQIRRAAFPGGPPSSLGSFTASSRQTQQQQQAAAAAAAASQHPSMEELEDPTRSFRIGEGTQQFRYVPDVTRVFVSIDHVIRWLSSSESSPQNPQARYLRAPIVRVLKALFWREGGGFHDRPFPLSTSGGSASGPAIVRLSEQQRQLIRAFESAS